MLWETSRCNYQLYNDISCWSAILDITSARKSTFSLRYGYAIISPSSSVAQILQQIPCVSMGSSSCFLTWSTSNWLVILRFWACPLLFRLSRFPPRPCSGFLPSPVTAPVLAGLLGIRPMAKLRLQFLGALQHQVNQLEVLIIDSLQLLTFIAEDVAPSTLSHCYFLIH